MKEPCWCIVNGRLFRVREVLQETKKTFILRLRGLIEVKEVRKKDKVLGFNDKRKPKGW